MKQRVIKMSANGRLVVPKGIRVEAGLKPGDKFVAFPIHGGVVFKKIDLSKELHKIAKEVSARARKYNVTKKDLERAIRKVRRHNNKKR